MCVSASLSAVPSIDLPYDRSSVGVARRWAADVLAGVVGDDVINDVTVCLSELVTNSLKHTAPTVDRKDITCKIHVRPLRSIMLIHVECVDPGSKQHAPVARPVSGTDEQGRGLQIVAGIATEWGDDDSVSGQRTTWFIVDVEQEEEDP
jgi:anti-sigma regulatory factor (Ser/Thr protein kinase)